jgi:hypothetical protein
VQSYRWLMQQTSVPLYPRQDQSDGLNGRWPFAMLVHRARRLEFTQLRPYTTIFGPDGHPVIRLESLQPLSRDPQLSDIEALLKRDRKQLVLTEQAERTLNGVL